MILPAATLTLVVPDLALRPALGSGCCALPAAQVVIEALAAIPGVRRVDYLEQSSELRLRLDGTPSDVASEARATLDLLSYPAAETRWE